MKLSDWFKKSKPKCSHYKNFGQKPLSNMSKIFEFCDTKNSVLGYSIYECNKCGKRSFGCMHLHLMGDNQCKVIDDFINYKMSRDDFIAFLTKEMAWHKELKNYRIRFKNMKLSDKEIEEMIKLLDFRVEALGSGISKDPVKAIRQLKQERDRYKEALLHIINDPYTNAYAVTKAKQALEKDDGSNI